MCPGLLPDDLDELQRELEEQLPTLDELQDELERHLPDLDDLGELLDEALQGEDLPAELDRLLDDLLGTSGADG